MNAIQRLAYSVAWKLFPHANAQFKLESGLRLPLTQRGDFASVEEIFIRRAYAPYFAHLGGVRSWVDLGCNGGYFSLALYEATGRPAEAEAVLIDANESCVRATRHLIKVNALPFSAEHGLIGPLGQTASFYQSKSTTRSSLFEPGSVEKKLHYRTLNLLRRFEGRRFDLLKADVEGAEKFLLADQADFFRQFRYVLMEWHEPHVGGEQLRQFAESLGGRILVLESQKPEFHGDPVHSPLGMMLWER